MSDDPIAGVKQDPFSGYRLHKYDQLKARAPEELAEMFMSPNAPKTEAEHWAVREIDKLRAEVARLREERNHLLDENMKLHSAVGKIREALYSWPLTHV